MFAEHPRALPKSTYTIYSLAFSPDGGLLAAGGGIWPEGPGEVRIFDTATGTLRHTPSETLPGMVGTVAFSPDGQILAVGGPNGYGSLWSVPTGKRLFLPGDPNSPEPCAFGAGSERVWDGDIESLAFSPDGTLLAVAGSDGILLLDARTGRRSKIIEPGKMGFQQATFLTGQMLATVEAFSLRLWDVDTGAERKTLLEGRGLLFKAAFSTRGDRFAVQFGWEDMDGGVMLHPCERDWGPIGEGHLLRTGGGSMGDICFSPDGTLLAIGDMYVTKVQLLDVYAATVRQELSCPFDRYNEAQPVAFSPDGRMLATTGPHYQALLWDAL